MRMARLIQFYYESNRSSKGKPSKLAQFLLYPDLAEEAEASGATEADLLNAIGGGSNGR
jgi:hypothetical protein